METKSPELSRDVAKSAMNLLDDFLRKKIQTRGGIKAAFATARLDEARMEMARSEDAFRRFMESNRNFQASGDPSIRLSGARFERELKLREQLVVTLAINREQALLEEKNDLPMLNFLDVPNLPLDHHGPYRLMYVLVALFSSSCLTWVWLNRLWIKRLSDN